MKKKLFTILFTLLAAVTGCGAPAVQHSSDATANTASKSYSVEDGEMLIEQNKFKDALAIFTDILKSDTNNAKAHFYAGLCQDKLGKISNAITHYEDSVKLDKSLVEAHINLGALYLDTQKSSKAVEQFKEASLLEPDEVDIILNLAYAEDAAGQKEDAKKSLQHAINLDDQNADPYIALGTMALENGKNKKALELFLKAQKINPNDPVNALNTANVYLALKKRKKAVKTLESIENMEAEGSMYAQAGLALAKLKKTDSSLKLYQKAIVAEPPYLKAHILMGNALARAKKFDDAVSHFEQYLKEDSTSKDAEAAKKGLAACRAIISKKSSAK